MKGARVRYLILGLVTTITVLLDQATKLHIMQTVRLHESIPIIGGFFNLTYIRNPGAAFGLLASTGPVFRTIFFGLASLFALGLLATIFFRLQPDDRAGQLSVAATLGGALGNLIDRIHTIDRSTAEVQNTLLELHFDYVVDLHNNVRSRAVKRALGLISFTVDKQNWAKIGRAHV